MNSFCIIGLGRFGRTLALKLAESGNQVMAIDRSESKVADIADNITDAVIGDASNEKFLSLAGVTNYDCAVVCFSKNVNDSVLVTLLLKEMGVKKVVVRASNEQHKKVLEKIGADMVVFPENDMGEKTAYLLSKQNVLEFIEFDDEHSIAEIVMPDKWVGKSARELDVRREYGITIFALRGADGNIQMTLNPDVPFKPADTLLIMGTNNSIEMISNGK